MFDVKQHKCWMFPSNQTDKAKAIAHEEQLKRKELEEKMKPKSKGK